jgi:hypothetical protein
VVTDVNRERAQAAGVLWIPCINPHAIRGWKNDGRHPPEKVRMDAQGRKGPRSLRNYYLTEDLEGSPQPSPGRYAGSESWCRVGARDPGSA